jgi:hypothetical protein
VASVTVEPGDFDTLSAASVYPLNAQGGPMSPAEAAIFEADPVVVAVHVGEATSGVEGPRRSPVGPNRGVDRRVRPAGRAARREAIADPCAVGQAVAPGRAGGESYIACRSASTLI